MTYITEQNSAELRAHIRSLQKHHGWSDAVTDRLFKEIVSQDEEIAELRAALGDSQSLLIAMLRGRISSEEIEEQIVKNHDALALMSS